MADTVPLYTGRSSGVRRRRRSLGTVSRRTGVPRRISRGCCIARAPLSSAARRSARRRCVMSDSSSTAVAACGAGDRPAAVDKRGVVVLLVAIALFVLTQLYLAIPLLAHVARDFDAPAAAATFALATSFSLAYAGGFLIWGPLSDQYGRRSMMLAGLAALSVSTFACAFAPSLLWLAALRALQGLAASSFAPIALAWLAEAMAPNRRATAIGAMSTAFLVAGIFGQVLAAWAALHGGWDRAFLITGACLTAAIPLVAAIVREPARAAVHGHLGHRFAALGAVVARPAVLLLSLAHVTLLLSFVAMYTALGPHLEALGLDAGKVILLRLVGLPGMFAALLVGPLAARIGMPGVASAGYVLAAAGLALEAALSHSLAGVACGSLAFVTGVALAVPSMITQFGALAEPNHAGGMALNGFVLFVGASVGPLVAARVPGFVALLTGLAAALVLAAACVAGSASLASSERKR
ncbi:MFS transporter [Brenneria populi subsp. brevivirga]|uniref:MFS transporter n=1 Tax=Brenneria populi TaxID=1505588 RepID=UPI002E189483|nr:MFS transporter [Brenneria populi subsp. brevivirga]